MFVFQKLKFQKLPLSLFFYLIFSLFFSCPQLLAAQDAIVTAERAIIYSDQEMTSAIGYIKKGKKISVGDVARNKAQVFPVVVSGKIAFIRVLDVTTERESMDSSRLVAERFKKVTVNVKRSKIVASYFIYNSQIDLNNQNAQLTDADPVTWNGVSLKGEVLLKNSWDLQVLLNFMTAKEETEKFNVVELGFGGAYRFFDTKNFIARAEAQFLAVPFSSYEVGSDFLVRSYGYTLGAGLNMTYFFSENWGVEGSLGVYQTHLLKFKSPEPYKEISPTFLGTRLGIGLNYSY